MLHGGSSRAHRDQANMPSHNQHTSSHVHNDPLDNYLSQDRRYQSSKMIQEVASSVLIESLAAEWWTTNLSQTVINDLLENLIPLVVLGCEKVINEADERNLIETTTPDRSFNPINRLASFLMRNNPKYIHYSSLSPYHLSMKSLLNTKRIQVLKVYGEEETLLRTMLKDRQRERYQHNETVAKEEERRKNLLRTLFLDWSVPERGWIQTKLINNMIEQYHELSKRNDFKLNVTPFSSPRMHLGSFTENFLKVLHDQSPENFDSVINVYRYCAQTYAKIIQEHELHNLLQRLFNQLDESKSGYLLRQSVIQTLESFYNVLNDNDKRLVYQPNQWPVVKYKELKIERTTAEHTPDVLEIPPEEKTGGSPVTNEHSITPTPAETEKDKTDEKQDQEQQDQDQQQEGQEQTNEQSKGFYLELRPISAYETDFRFSNQLKPTYNLEHFEPVDHEKSTVYDEQLIDKIQFSSLLVSFFGLQKNELVVSALIDYFRSNYKELEEEKNEKKSLVQQRITDKQQRAQSDALFEKLNTTCTEVIKLEPLANSLKQYKEGAMVEAIEQVLESYQDQTQLSSTQFFDLLINIFQAVNEVSGGTEKFDELIKFIDMQQPLLNAADKTRIQTRQQWLKRIRSIPFRTSSNLYKEVMEVMQKDSDTFGNQPPKYLSIYIALLENDKNRLRYVATTKDQTGLLLDKTLERGEGVSFHVLDSGKWAYFNQTKNHTRIKFFNPDTQKQSGSFVLIPLKRLQQKNAYGVLGVDTLKDKKEKAFIQHEVQFYEGIASVLSDTFTFVDFDKNMMKVLHRFTYWIQQRCSNVKTVDYYTYEPVSMNNLTERLLKHAATYSNGNLNMFNIPKTISTREHVFKYSLEHAAVACQSTITTFLGQTHMIQAMRGRDNICFALIDTNIGEQQELPNEERQDIITMYNCIYMAVDELEQELIDDTIKQVLEYEKESDIKHFDHLFDRIWYMDTCRVLKQLPTEKFNEFFNNKSKWNDETKQILSVIGRIVKKKELNPSEYVNDLLPSMIEFDPTTQENRQIDLWNRAEQLTKNINRSIWEQPSSDVIKVFYDWLSLACELAKFSKV